MSLSDSARRVYPAAVLLGAGALSLVDFGTSATAAGIGFIGEFLAGLAANRADRKTAQEEEDAALASTLLQNAQITSHCGRIIAALVRDAAAQNEALGEWSTPLASLADAIPDWWNKLCDRDPHFAASLQGQRFIHTLTTILTEENAPPALTADTARQLFAAAVKEMDTFPAVCLPILASLVSSRFNNALAAGLAKSGPASREAFGKSLLRFHAETLANAKLQLELSRETFAGVREIHDGVARLIADLSRTYADFRGYFEEILRSLHSLHSKVDTVVQNQTAAGADARLTAYRATLLAAFRSYEELGLTNYRNADDKSPDIWQIFVAPGCSHGDPVSPKQMDDAQRADPATCPAQDLLPILADPACKRHVLLADPGMGKSVLIQQLTCALADSRLPREAATLRGAIPIPIVLRELIPLLKDREPNSTRWSWELLCDVLREHYRHGSHALFAQYKDRCHFHDELLSSPRAFFLIDGLDEIGSTAGRAHIRDAIQQGFLACPQARWLITSRIVGYEQAQVHETSMDYGPIDKTSRDKAWQFLREWRPIALECFEHISDSYHAEAKALLARILYLAPFDDDRQRRFLANWFALRNTEDTTPGLLEEVHAHSNDGIRLIARVPNLLCYMAMLKRGKQPLPHGRAELYKEIARAYIESIDAIYKVESKDMGHECPFAHHQRYYLLYLLAAEMQARRSAAPAQQNEAEDGENGGNILISAADALATLRPAAERFLQVPDATAQVRQFFTHITSRSGLLIDRGTGPGGEALYAFTHLSFLEYFAACWLRDRLVDEASRRLEIADDIHDPDTWAREHPPGPLTVEKDNFTAWTPDPAWHEVLLFLTELRSAHNDELRSLLRLLFPALTAAKDPAYPTGEDKHPVPFMFTGAVALAMRIATDRYLRDFTDTRRLWLSRLWHAYLLWPHHPWLGNGWPIAPLLLEHPEHHTESLTALGTVIEQHHLLEKPVNLYQCTTLKAVEHLPGSLQTLDLGGCTGLTSLEHVPGNLQSLNLSECTGLTSLEHLPGNLQSLNLSECTGLTSLEHLPGNLQSLDLSGCTGLTSLEHLPGNLQTLYLNRCTGLTSLEHLPGNLQTLYLIGCTGLTSLEHLPEALRHLDVDGCKNLVRLGPLPAGLRHVDIQRCPKLDAETRERLRKWAAEGEKGSRTLRE